MSIFIMIKGDIMIKGCLNKILTYIFTFVCCALLLGGALKACDFIEAQEDEEHREERENRTVMEGSDGYLTDSSLVAIDEDSFEEMLKYSNTSNDDALRRMIVNGFLFIGDQGSRITVVDHKFGKSLIEVVDTGQRGYVENEFIVKKLEE